MIYIVFKKGESAEWDTIHIFTSYSIVEQYVNTDKYYVIAYEGIDNLVPVWQYQYINGRLQRFSL